MGTRKLRLIHLAYLRGARDIIKVGYPHGIRSILRERLILDALDWELFTSAQKELIHHSAALMTPHLDPSKINDLHHKMQRELQRLQRLASLDMSTPKDLAKGSIDAAAKLFQSMDSGGFFKSILELHHRLNPSLAPD